MNLTARKGCGFMDRTIITISREYGSGGHEIGKKLADELNIPFYDNELISLAAERSGFSEDVIRSAENVPSSNILFSLSRLGPSAEIYGMPLSEKIFQAQSQAIRELAGKGSCVFIGRCADYVLQDLEDCIHVFITASLGTRVRRAVQQYELDTNTAEKKVIKTDKSREVYYNFHTNLKWGHPANYDLIINTDHTGIDDAVVLLKSYVLMRKKNEFTKPMHQE